MVRNELLPWVLRSWDLGDDCLEIGPGPGVTTDLLRTRARWVTAVELDPALSETLAARLAGTNVEVVNADATSMPFEADRFSGAVCLTMLHHVPSAALQDRLFAEVARVLRPGATLLGSDSIEAPEVRAGHTGDIFVPVAPDQLGARLVAAGFEEPEVETKATRMRFAARKPLTSAS
jgi:SAM-dependent methyltransferase